MRALWVCGLVAVVAVTLNLSISNDLHGQQPPAKSKGGTVIQLDLSKLPPDLAQKLLEFATTNKDQGKTKESKGKDGKTKSKAAVNKGAANAISLGEAVAIAEKAGKGQAYSAQRKDGLDYTHFTIQVNDKDGGKTKFTVGGSGAILEQKKGGKD